MKKASFIIFITFLLINATIVPTFAVDISGIINEQPTVPVDIENKINTIWENVFKIFATIGCGIAVIMLIVVAIKYMSAAPNDKAEIKKYLIIYVVGAIFILCCVGVVSLLKEVAGELLL